MAAACLPAARVASCAWAVRAAAEVGPVLSDAADSFLSFSFLVLVGGATACLGAGGGETEVGT